MARRIPESVRNEAWLGDAVLSLYVRRWILRNKGVMDGLRLAAFTSNQFLGSIGHPTDVEARIGQLYESEGLDRAFQWIEENLLPLFLTQERRRLRQRE